MTRRRREPDYITAAAHLFVLENRQNQLKAEIDLYTDYMLGAGMRAVQSHRDSRGLADAAAGPGAAVTAALQCHHDRDWGLAMPDGLCINDLKHATGLTWDEVSQGLAELGDRCARGWDRTLIRERGRYKLVPDGEVAR